MKLKKKVFNKWRKLRKELREVGVRSLPMLIVCHSSFRCFWLPLVLLQQLADNVSLKTLGPCFSSRRVCWAAWRGEALAVQVGPINIFDRPAAVP